MLDTMKVVAKRIKELRMELELSQESFGKLLHVSQDTVSLWENGRALPTTEFVIAMCRQFDVSADYLLGLRDY